MVSAPDAPNQAESFFSRLRRAEIGIHHHISGRYLAGYANEMAWREAGVLQEAIAEAPSRQAWCDAVFRLYGPDGKMIRGLMLRR